MNLKLLSLILVTGICLNTNVLAQKGEKKNNKKITISGTVLDVDKGPISNAIIMIDDQKTNVFTDINGN